MPHPLRVTPCTLTNIDDRYPISHARPLDLPSFIIVSFRVVRLEWGTLIASVLPCASSPNSASALGTAALTFNTLPWTYLYISTTEAVMYYHSPVIFLSRIFFFNIVSFSKYHAHSVRKITMPTVIFLPKVTIAY